MLASFSSLRLAKREGEEEEEEETSFGRSAWISFS